MLRQVLLFTRDLSSSVRFFGDKGLGLKVLYENEKFAELTCALDDAPNPQDRLKYPSLALQFVEREAECSTGYSPLLRFDVADLDIAVQRLLQNNGRLDGPIRFPIDGRIASIRSPCGHMVALFEPNPELQTGN